MYHRLQPVQEQVTPSICINFTVTSVLLARQGAHARDDLLLNRLSALIHLLCTFHKTALYPTFSFFRTPAFHDLTIFTPGFLWYHYYCVLQTIKEIRGSSRVVDQDPEGKYEALSRYARDLTKAARDGKLDPVIGRDDEIRRAIQILSRRTKNNPVLIGGERPESVLQSCTHVLSEHHASEHACRDVSSHTFSAVA